MNYEPEFIGDNDDKIKSIQETFETDFINNLVLKCCNFYKKSCDLLEVENNFKEIISTKENFYPSNFLFVFEFISAYFRFANQEPSINMFSETEKFKKSIKDKFISYLNSEIESLINNNKIIQLIIKIYCFEQDGNSLYENLKSKCERAKSNLMLELGREHSGFSREGDFRFTRVIKYLNTHENK